MHKGDYRGALGAHEIITSPVSISLSPNFFFLAIQASTLVLPSAIFIP